MDSIVTPTADAVPILSQIVSSRLNLPLDVALCSDARYWRVKVFYDILGCGSKLSFAVSDSLYRSGVASGIMGSASTLDRICASLPPTTVTVQRVPDSDIQG